MAYEEHRTPHGASPAERRFANDHYEGVSDATGTTCLVPVASRRGALKRWRRGCTVELIALATMFCMGAVAGDLVPVTSSVLPAAESSRTDPTTARHQQQLGALINQRPSSEARRELDEDALLARMAALEAAVQKTEYATNEAWLLVSSTLVLMMTISGLALFYGGLVRVQNVLATVMQSFAIACLVTFMWISFGYSLSFTRGSPVIGSYQRFWLTGMTLESHHEINPGVSEPIFCMYELTFAIITPALIPGAFADRMRFGPMLLFIALWHLLVYCPIAHSTWMTDGFLHKAGVLDFAGGNVVHVAAGFSGLVSSIIVGKRTGYGHEQFSAHNMLISVLGASLLWVGWCGFNGGAAGHPSPQASMAVLNTNIAAATSSLAWMVTEWILRQRPSVLGMISGAIAGLVCITPGAGYVNVTGAFCFGIIAGPTVFFASQLKDLFHFDDALDAFGIHGPGGVLGGLLTAFFATESIAGKDGNGNPINGIFYGDNGWLLLMQLYGAVVTIAWSVVMTFLIMKGLDLTIGIRVAVEEELIGLDMVVHGHNTAAMPPFRSNDGSNSARRHDDSTGSKARDVPTWMELSQGLHDLDEAPVSAGKSRDYQKPNRAPDGHAPMPTSPAGIDTRMLGDSLGEA